MYKPIFKKDPIVLMNIISETMRDFGLYLTDNDKRSVNNVTKFENSGRAGHKMYSEIKRRIESLS
jgi:hypothetical protein